MNPGLHTGNCQMPRLRHNALRDAVEHSPVKCVDHVDPAVVRVEETAAAIRSSVGKTISLWQSLSIFRMLSRDFAVTMIMKETRPGL